ncbi:YkgJ family cysteine cluster protein [Bacillus cytotoxicus]|uniref:YkgJ family cysteine cluster protein n=1 Tax=Bacillus cytotoxicus TaxID=580165 RepID=UPI0035CBB2B6
MKNFPCTKCGICCQNVQGIDSLSHLNRGDGCCVHYDTDNHSCTIYEERPLLCNIALAYEELFKKSMSKKDFYLLNVEACNELQEMHQVPSAYRIDIKKSIG